MSLSRSRLTTYGVLRIVFRSIYGFIVTLLMASVASGITYGESLDCKTEISGSKIASDINAVLHHGIISDLQFIENKMHLVFEKQEGLSRYDPDDKLTYFTVRSIYNGMYYGTLVIRQLKIENGDNKTSAFFRILLLYGNPICTKTAPEDFFKLFDGGKNDFRENNAHHGVLNISYSLKYLVTTKNGGRASLILDYSTNEETIDDILIKQDN